MQHLSKEFRIETVDHKLKKLSRRGTDNMSVCHPEDQACKNHPYTRITFLPDYARFGMDTSTPI
jgi:hypothetical protein